MANKQHLILIGLMGVGKSTIGRQLAAHMGAPFVDTDQQIEREQKTQISTIFKQQGEAFFRELEVAMLKKNSTTSERTIIATGGGIVIQALNRACMVQHGLVVWLNVSPDNIYRRLRGNRSRPLLQQTDALQKLKELYAQRVLWYQQCSDLEIQCDHLKPRQVVDKIVQFMAESGHEKATLSR